MDARMYLNLEKLTNEDKVASDHPTAAANHFVQELHKKDQLVQILRDCWVRERLDQVRTALA